MLLEIYIIIVILGFVFLGFGLHNGSYGSKISIPDGQNYAVLNKVGLTVIYLLLSSIMFTFLSFQSMDITTEHCENQITQTEININTTTYTNSINCLIQHHKNSYLAGFFGCMVVFNIVMLFVYVGDKAWV